jgi:uncharacterized YccA/Bax inhibitor family protein
MANPMLNDKSLEKASTWGPGSAASADTMTQWPPPGMERPAGLDGESRGMTMRGTAWATSVLMALLLLSAAFGWVQTASPTTGFNAAGQQVTNFTIPMLAWVGVGVGFVCLIGLWFRPRMAKFIAPVYALAQGFFVGAISKMYESFQGGIVVQAIGATLAVFLVMLFLYGFRIIKVTDKFRRTVIFATLGIMVFYGISFLISLFAGAQAVSFLSSSTPLSIGFSVIVAGIAAMNLALDFDFIERGEKMGLDRDFEWYGAFGLLVTIIWLYLELLRLLSKLRN